VRGANLAQIDPADRTERVKLETAALLVDHPHAKRLPARESGLAVVADPECGGVRLDR
jgi:hypothetical protein